MATAGFGLIYDKYCDKRSKHDNRQLDFVALTFHKSKNVEHITLVFRAFRLNPILIDT